MKVQTGTTAKKAGKKRRNKKAKRDIILATRSGSLSLSAHLDDLGHPLTESRCMPTMV